VSVARCQEINARLRAAGVVVHELPGWQSRGNGMTSAYTGGIVHHTGGPFGTALAGNGRANELVKGTKKLSGPLCNYAGNEDGSITVVAAHPANHAGASGGRSMGPLPRTGLFNKFVLGLEIIYSGFEPMHDVQYRSAVLWSRIVVAVCGHGDAERVRAHGETSITGKWDPGFAKDRTIDMNAFRNAVREDDLTPDEHNMLKFVHDRVAGIMPQRFFAQDADDPAAVREVGANAQGAQPAHVLDTLDGNFIVRQIQRLREENEPVTLAKLRPLSDAVAARVPHDLADEFIAELRAAFERLG
jgi:N-acetylmuramoyl-L-alanine amidase-like protein